MHWEQPDGYYLGRAAGSETVVDTASVPGSTYRMLQADQCGNALFVYNDPTAGELYLRHYIAGSGWASPQAVDAARGAPANHIAVGMANGRAVIVFVYASRYYAALFGPQ